MGGAWAPTKGSKIPSQSLGMEISSMGYDCLMDLDILGYDWRTYIGTLWSSDILLMERFRVRWVRWVFYCFCPPWDVGILWTQKFTVAYIFHRADVGDPGIATFTCHDCIPGRGSIQIEAVKHSSVPSVEDLLVPLAKKVVCLVNFLFQDMFGPRILFS